MNANTIPNSLPHDGVLTVNEWDLLGVLDARSDEYEVQTIKIKQWIADNEAFYYARPDELFCIFEAVRLAKANGKTVVVVDNMS